MNSYRRNNYLDTRSNYHQDQKQQRLPKFSIEQSHYKRKTLISKEKIDEYNWLQKYAKENYKMSDSTLFDDQQPQMQKIVDVMKFSFNQNFTDQVLQENRQKTNRQTYNNYQHKKLDCLPESNGVRKQPTKQKGQKRVKQNLVGSIKRNRTYENISQKRRLTSIFDDEVEINGVQKLSEMQNKLRKNFKPKLSILSSNYVKDCVANSQTNQFDNKCPSRKNLNQQCQKILTQKDLNWINRCLQNLFNRLDRNQIGILSNRNCWIDGLNEEVKFIFGTIFSRIRLKNQQFTLQQFQREGQIIMQPFNQQQYQWIFDDLEQKNSASLKKQRQDRKSKQITNISNKRIDNDNFFVQKAKKVDFVEEINKTPYIDLEQTRRDDDMEIIQENKKLTISKLGKISKEVITEHKKNLEDLDRLNQIMQSYLGNQKAAIFSEYSGYSKKKGRLRFEQLIKHI